MVIIRNVEASAGAGENKTTKEKEMKKETEVMDTWLKTQEEFVQNWVNLQKQIMENGIKSQKEFVENWITATKKLQETVVNMGGVQEGPAKEVFNQYNTWVTTMANSSKVFYEDALKIQDSWKNSLDKQMGMFKSFSGLFTQAAGK